MKSKGNQEKEWERVISSPAPNNLRGRTQEGAHIKGSGNSAVGGDWDRVINNLQQLQQLRDRFNPGMVVEVAYHIYKTTFPNDVAKVRRMCTQLGFIFRPHRAALLPLDNVLDYERSIPLSSPAMATIELLHLPIDEALAAAQAQKRYQCRFERTLCIESDRSVKQCGLWTRPDDNTAADDFCTTSLDTIVRNRKESDLCRICKEKGLHRFCSIYTDTVSDCISSSMPETVCVGGSDC